MCIRDRYTPLQQRQLAGIRYEMERQGFSITTPYTLAEDVAVSTVIQIKERSYELSGVMVVESTIDVYKRQRLKRCAGSFL